MKRLGNLFLAALLAFAPVAHADLRASSGGFGPITATSGSVATAVTGLPTLLTQSWAAVSAPADTNEDTLATITVPGNTMGANGAIRVQLSFSYTNNANVKTLRVRWSGASGTQLLNIARSTQVVSSIVILLANRNATNSQISNALENNEGAGFAQQQNPTAVDTTATQTIVITGQKATAGDTLTLDGLTAEVIH